MSTKKKTTAKKATKKNVTAKKAVAKKATAKKAIAKKAVKKTPVLNKSKIVAMPSNSSISADDVALEAYYVFEERMRTGASGDEKSDWDTAVARLSTKGKVEKTA